MSNDTKNEVIYRGQSDEKWGVESGAYRRLKAGRPLDTEDVQNNPTVVISQSYV